jgi:hypothetical protein
MSSTCVHAHALLSALVLRVEREGFVAAERDLSALLALGVTEAEISTALGRVGNPAAIESTAVLRRVAAAGPQRGA